MNEGCNWQAVGENRHDSWPIQPDILSPPLLRLTSRKPLWLDLQPVDIKSRWRHNWKSAQVVNSHLVCDPTICQSGFDLPQQQWSLLNHFRTEQGHCSACRRKWRLTDTDPCPCGDTQTMSHIVESCPPDKTEWRLISATLCGRSRCFMADQLWFMTHIREEEEGGLQNVHLSWSSLFICEYIFCRFSSLFNGDIMKGQKENGTATVISFTGLPQPSNSLQPSREQGRW